MTKSVCIIQARTTSSRLPGKVLLPLNGHTVIEEVISRAKQINTDDLVVAVPFGDKGLGEIAGRHCRVVYGPEYDVFERFEKASEGFASIMRITADCPLLSPDLCNEVLAALTADTDYVSNCEPPTFPKGFDCEVFWRNVWLGTRYSGAETREHVTYELRRGSNYTRKTIKSPWSLQGRLTLDTIDDYRTILAAFADRERHPEQKISDLPKAEPAPDFNMVPKLFVGQIAERYISVPQGLGNPMVAESQLSVWTGKDWAPFPSREAILAIEEKLKKEVLHAIAETH